jgi:hypothetical protein
MKRGITILLSLCVLVAAAYFTASKWAIRHETITFYDAARANRKVEVDIAVRRDKEMQADSGMITLPVAVLRIFFPRQRFCRPRLYRGQRSARPADRSSDGDQSW